MNKRMILNLTTQNPTYRLLSLTIALHALASLGLRWRGLNGGDPVPNVDQITALVVSPKNQNPTQLEISYYKNFNPKAHLELSDRVFEPTRSGTFNFLEAVANFAEEAAKPAPTSDTFETEIEGVQVIVTKEGCIMDASDLLSRVENKAHAIAKEKFGVKG